MNVYANRCVLVTGHTGFKGRHLTKALEILGANVHGFSIDARDDSCGDVRDFHLLANRIATLRPSVIFHFAAQALVPVGFKDPLLTFATNMGGTVNLLEALREYDRRCAVVIATTDKVYGGGEEYGYEEMRLTPRCPYSASKIAAEHAVKAYRDAFFGNGGGNINVATVRAGNVIGPGDDGEGRLVPNAVKALRVGKPVSVYNPYAVRPWQYVDDVIEGYLRLGATLIDERRASPFCSPFNLGPSVHHTVREVVENIIAAWGSGRWEHVRSDMHEVEKLYITNLKAQRLLGWKPHVGFDDMIKRTVEWYRANP